MEKDVAIRAAKPEDNQIIYQYVFDLAKYQGIESRLTVDETSLKQLLFDENSPIECLVLEERNNIIGFALFSEMNNNRMYQTAPGLYIEELYIHPDHRKAGLGKQLFIALEAIAQQRNYNRIEWWVVAGNDMAEQFYLKLGAQAYPEYQVWRLKEEKFHDAA